MGGGAKTKRTLPAVFHPNSRKAGQKIKRLAHDQRLTAQQRLRDLKDKAQREKIVWFQDQVDDVSRPLCPHNLDELIDRFLARREDDINYFEDKQDIPNRRLNKDLVKADDLRRLAEEETNVYDSSGIEVPDITTTKGLSAVQKWGSDIIDLVKVPMKKFNRRQLCGAAVGPCCVDCSLVAQVEPVEEDDAMKGDLSPFSNKT